jgi:methylated-DNA-[protein]-cysteine S-methyltransferase
MDAYSLLSTPVGRLALIASSRGLCAVLWAADLKQQKVKSMIGALNRDENHPVLLRAARQLEEYFKGGRTKFDLPLDVRGGTTFQKRAWLELRKIPFGQTISYRDQAQNLGDAKKARAVGGANGKNPLSIIVPCHRVIAASGQLGGFGGGLKAKKYLLNLESARAGASSRPS